jgi:Protein of unknown function (DUF1488).
MRLGAEIVAPRCLLEYDPGGTEKPGWGHVWEATMALIFEPQRVVYDPSEGLMRFFAADGVALVECAISKAALTALEDDALAGVHAMVITYRRHRELIQEITERKYRMRRLEDGGRVVVRLEDVTAQLPQHRSLVSAAS